MRNGLALLLAVFVSTTAVAQDVEFEAPSTILSGIDFTVTVRAPTSLDSIPFTIQRADGSVLASGLPAWRASRTSVREVLAYA